MEDTTEVLFSFKMEKKLKHQLKLLSIEKNISMKDLIIFAINKTYTFELNKKNKT